MPEATRSIRILLVDDEPSQLELTKLALQNLDKSFEIESVLDPKNAINLLHSAKYDCIVSDYQMPSMNGIELCRQIREFTDTPFIIYTGRGSEEVASAAFQAGVDDYIRKEPAVAHYEVLANRIRQQVEKRKAEEKLRESEQRYTVLNENLQDIKQNVSSTSIVGLVIVLTLVILMAGYYAFGVGQTVFNPPYLAFVLQLLFVFGVGLVVAYVSAKSYLQTGAINVLLLGVAILVSSLSFMISATALTPEFPQSLPVNQAVIIGNVGVLISSFVLLASAAVTWRGAEHKLSASRKTVVAASLLASVATVAIVSILSILGVFPLFLTSSGPTITRLAVLALTTILYFASSALFGLRYIRARSQTVYWFTLALALNGTAYLAGVLTVTVGGGMTWVS